MLTSVKSYIRGCDTCLRVKSGIAQGALQPLLVPAGRWERIGMDFVTKMPPGGPESYDTICTIVNHLTKQVHWFPKHESCTAPEFAWLFVSNYVRLHGIPTTIVSDRDVKFMSDFWQELWKNMGTKLKVSTPFHPQTDGQAEKLNDIVKTYLRAFATKYHGDWPKLLGLAEFSYNSSEHKTTRRSPFETDLGYTPALPIDTLASVINSGNWSARAKQGVQFKERLTAILKDTQDMIEEARTIMQAGDKGNPHDFKVGDMVFLKTKHLPATYANLNDATSRKLQHRFAGPFEITYIRGNAARLK